MQPRARCNASERSVARERRGPFKSRAQAGPRAEGAHCAARVGGVGSRRKSFLPTLASRAAAAAHSSPGPGAGPATVARATARGRAGLGRAAPAVSLWRVEPPPAPGRPSASPGLRARVPALGLPWGCRGAAVGPGPGGTRGTAWCPPHVPRRRGCARGPGTCSAQPSAGAQGQDESDSVLREGQHRGALQGRPAAGPRAHPAGAAAVPEDPGPGEGRRRGGHGARLPRGTLWKCPRPRTCPAPWTRWRFLWGSDHPQRLERAACSYNFCRLLI